MNNPIPAGYGDTPLHSAVRANDLQTVVHLLEVNPASVDEKNKVGETALYLACGEGYAEVASHLLGCNANVNVANNAGWMPLHQAAVSGHLRLVQLLVAAWADPDSLTLQGGSSLTLLQPDRSPEHAAIFGWLLAHGAVYDLYTAVACGMIHVASAMVAANPTGWLNSPRSSSAIVKACGLFYLTKNLALINKRRMMARMLLEHGANPNEVAGGTSPLVTSIVTNDTELAALLIRHGADVNLTVESGSPIQMARRVGNPDLVELLLRHGAHDDGVDVSGQLPF